MVHVVVVCCGELVWLVCGCGAFVSEVCFAGNDMMLL